MQKVHLIKFFLILIGLLLFTHLFSSTIYAGDHPCMDLGQENYPGECVDNYEGRTRIMGFVVYYNWMIATFLFLSLSIPVIILARKYYLHKK